MKALNFLFQICKLRLEIIINSLVNTHDISKPQYKVEEIDLVSDKIIIRCAYSHAIIKTTVVDVVSDIKIISGLSSFDACSIGGYFGRLVRINPGLLDKQEVFQKISFSLEKGGKSNYNLVFEDFSGKIGYIDAFTKQEFLEYPEAIVNSEYIVSKFPPSQACYIGILAGIRIEKIFDTKYAGKKSSKCFKNELVKLRIIK